MRDVIVVGAGGGGPVVAKELAARGLDVLLLEAGPRHGNPRQEWTHFENDANNPVSGFLRFGPADRSKPAWLRDLPQPSFIWQVSGVGGTTKHYYGNSPRAYPGVFTGYNGPDAAAYDTAHLFPFTYESLIPYYEWVEATLPVQTAAMGTKERVFFDGAEAVGLPLQESKDISRAAFRPQQNAILQPGGTAGRTSDPKLLTFPQATGCTFCGYCLQGCMQPVNAPRNQAAKRSTDNSYVPMAITADVWAPSGRPAHLITDVFVTKIHTTTINGQLTANGVTWRENSTGETHREDATVVVLAAGCVEDPRLWFHSDLPNPNDWVGRGVTDHYLDWVVGLFNRTTNSSKGAASSARADFPGYGGLENVGLGPAVQAFSMAYSASGVRGQYTNGRGYTGGWDGPAGRVMGPELKDALSNGVDRLLNVLVITADDVQAQNRITRSPIMPADEHGPVARPTLDFTARTAQTVARRHHLANRAAEILRGAGATKVYRLDWSPLVLHVQSSMRMGTSEADSVLDPNAEARWVKRLFIADNAALANGAGGANPTLTTQALATRTAEVIFTRYFGGDPWVGSEAPVVSTDDRISAALPRVH